MFKALMLTQQDKRTQAALIDLAEDQLPAGDVTVQVEYSSLNYKDALAVTGRGLIVKKWPMVPGIAAMPPQRVTTQTQAAAAATSSSPAGLAPRRRVTGRPVTRTT